MNLGSILFGVSMVLFLFAGCGYWSGTLIKIIDMSYAAKCFTAGCLALTLLSFVAVLITSQHVPYAPLSEFPELEFLKNQLTGWEHL